MSRRSAITLAGIVAILLFAWWPSPPTGERPRLFVVSKTASTQDIVEKLREQDLVHSPLLLRFILLWRGGLKGIDPGGYRLTEDPGLREIATVLAAPPDLLWITIPEGLRKEEIAQRLNETLSWPTDGVERFVHPAVETPFELGEGFFFPDTYLIPRDEKPEDVARRMIVRFREQFEPLMPALQEQNIRYNTAIKLASIIQREAAGVSDMPLIAGILWNRLLQNKKLEVDATLQYGRGDKGDGYWAAIDIAEKRRDSLFNTYMYPGLPPQPISNPGLDAIKAVISPEETQCLFYLHAADRRIHCSETYEGHLQNIETYLR